MSEAPAKPADAAAAPKSKKTLVMIVAAVVLLAGGGGGGYWWWSHRTPPAEGEAAHEEEAEKVPPGIVSFDPFVANLADGGGRFLRAQLKLVVENEEKAKEIEESAVEKARVQSAVLEVLTEQTADDLVTPEGKAALRDEISEKAQAILEETKVTDVLFTEFVVQF